MKTSLTAQFLRNNNAFAKNITKNRVDFYNPNNLYLGSMTRVHNKQKYKFTSIITFDDNLQKNFYKTVKQYFERLFVVAENPENSEFIANRIITEIVEKDCTKGASRRIVKEKVLETPLKKAAGWGENANVFEKPEHIKYSKFNILEDTTKNI